MTRLRSSAAVTAIVMIVAGWIACGPLTGNDRQLVTGGSGSGSMMPPFDAPPDGSGSAFPPPFDAPPDISIIPPDVPIVPPDVPREGGVPDAPPFDALPDVPNGELPPDGPVITPDAAIDAPSSPPPDAPIVPDAGAHDAASSDGAGMNGTPFLYQETSFYDCQCSHGRSPLGGWPIGAAIALLIFRRRRGSSSAR